MIVHGLGPPVRKPLVVTGGRPGVGPDGCEPLARQVQQAKGPCAPDDCNAPHGQVAHRDAADARTGAME